jgi:hypothetical protein
MAVSFEDAAEETVTFDTVLDEPMVFDQDLPEEPVEIPEVEDTAIRGEAEATPTE